ncbi:MAG: hypothetical protein WC050_01105 [Candidatus Paceibacterota bacterium]
MSTTYEQLQQFALGETKRIRTDRFDAQIVAKNGKYQRRAEVTLLLMERVKYRDAVAPVSKMDDIFNTVKDISDRYYQKRQWRLRWRWKREFAALVERVNSY